MVFEVLGNNLLDERDFGVVADIFLLVECLIFIVMEVCVEREVLSG